VSADAPLLLASTSPRRVALLTAAGIAFEAVDPGVDEALAGDAVASPSRRAVVIALAKARAVARLRPGRLVVAADTLVVIDDEALGKPRDAAEALWMLSRLSGATHEVVTGVAAVTPQGEEATTFATTLVEFARWPAEALRAAAASPRALDKAGAYGIQEVAGAYIVRLVGTQDNVAGLPVHAVRRLLARLALPGVATPVPRG